MLIVLFTVLIFATLLGIPALASDAEEARKLKVQKETLKALREEKELLQDIKTLKGEQVAMDEAMAAAQRKMNREQERGLKNFEKALVEAQAAADIEQNKLKALRQSEKRLEAMLADSEALNALSTAEQEELLESIVLVNEQIEAQKRLTEETENTLDTSSRNARAVEKLSGHIQSAAKRTLGLASSWENNVSGGIFKTISAVMSIEGAFDDLEADIAATLAPANLFMGLIDKIGQSTLRMALIADQAFANFRRSTGATQEFDEMIVQTRFDTQGLGVTFDVALASITDLYAGMRQFTLQTEEAQGELAVFSSTMTRLGVSSQTTAGFMDVATTALGMGTDAAMDAERELTAAASALGALPEEMIAGFNAAMPVLAKWGDEAVDVFIGLQEASLATGASVDQLLGVVGQFDTFAGAAEAAGRLNAVLGDDLLNSVDLLNASEEERVQMLQESIEMSGKSWDSMGRFERQALAAAAGITDMSVAAQVFRSDAENFRAAEERAAALGMSVEEMQAKAEANTSAQEGLKVMLESLAIATIPIVDLMNIVMSLFTGIAGVTGKWFTPALMGLIAAVHLLGVTWKGTLGIFGLAIAGYYALTELGLSNAWALGILTGALVLYMATVKRSLVWDNLKHAAFVVEYYWEILGAKAKWQGIMATNAGTLATMRNTLVGWKGIVMRKASTAATWLQTAATNALGISMMKAMGIVGLLVAAFFAIKDITGSTTKAIAGMVVGLIVFGVASKWAGGWIGAIVGALAALVAIIVTPHSPPLYLLLPLLALGIVALGMAGNAALPGLISLGTGLGAVGVGLGVVAGPLALIIVSVAVLVASVALLVAAFSLLLTAAAGLVDSIGGLFLILKEFNPLTLLMLAGGLLAFSLALLALGVAGLVALPGLIALGTGLFFVGIGLSYVAPPLALIVVSVALLVVAFSLLMDAVANVVASIGGLFLVFKEMDPLILFALAGGLLALGLAFLALGVIFAIPFTTLGLFAVSAGLSKISEAMAELSAEKINAFNELVSNLGKIQELGDIETTLGGVAGGIEEIAEAIDEVPVAKSFALSQTLSKITELATVATPANMDSAMGMADVIKEIADINVGLTSMIVFDNAVDNLIRVLSTATGGAAGGGAAAGGPGGGAQTVILELDRRELGRTVVELVKERYPLRTMAS